MRRGTLPLLLFIIVLAVGAAYVVFWPTYRGKWKLAQSLEHHRGP